MPDPALDCCEICSLRKAGRRDVLFGSLNAQARIHTERSCRKPTGSGPYGCLPIEPKIRTAATKFALWNRKISEQTSVADVLASSEKFKILTAPGRAGVRESIGHSSVAFLFRDDDGLFALTSVHHLRQAFRALPALYLASLEEADLLSVVALRQRLAQGLPCDNIRWRRRDDLLGSPGRDRVLGHRGRRSRHSDYCCYKSDAHRPTSTLATQRSPVRE